MMALPVAVPSYQVLPEVQALQKPPEVFGGKPFAGATASKDQFMVEFPPHFLAKFGQGWRQRRNGEQAVDKVSSAIFHDWLLVIVQRPRIGQESTLP